MWTLTNTPVVTSTTTSSVAPVCKRLRPGALGLTSTLFSKPFKEEIMKRNKYAVIATAALGLVLGGCAKKFDTYKQNPNEPTVVPPGQLLRSIEADMYIAPFGQEERNDQYTCSNYNYYDDNAYWDGVFH